MPPHNDKLKSHNVVERRTTERRHNPYLNFLYDQDRHFVLYSMVLQLSFGFIVVLSHGEIRASILIGAVMLNLFSQGQWTCSMTLLQWLRFVNDRTQRLH